MMKQASTLKSPGCVFIALLGAFLLGPGAGAQEPTVSVVTSARQDIVQLIRATGSVTSPRAAMLSTAVGGLIESYTVDIGDAVAVGDLLVQLDGELAQLELEAAQASEAEANIALKDARRRLAEAEQLGGESGVIPATEIESRRTDVAIREAGLAVARANVRQRQALVARHIIRAPFAGFVSERPAEIGEWVNPGDALLQLVATTHLRFDFRLPQSAFVSITTTTPVTLGFDALPGREFVGHVAAIVPVSDPADRTFLLRVTADTLTAGNEMSRVMPGMSARAQVAIDTGRSAVVVPRDALLRYPDGRMSVWIVQSRDGRTVAAERRVKTGLEFDGLVEIPTGLEPGLNVIVRGNESLRDGQPVTVR